MTVYRTTSTFDLTTDYRVPGINPDIHLHADRGDGNCECGAAVRVYRVVEALPDQAETVEYSAYVIEVEAAHAVCGEACAYGERRCALRAGHDDPDHHMGGDGFHWLHHEELIACAGDGDLTDDLWEMWDEPIDRLNVSRARDSE